jgi:hypothetical protein
MTAKSLILCTIGLALFLSIVKIVLVSLVDLTPWYMVILFAVVTALVTTAIVRRAGIVNHFETIVSLVFWVPLVILWDFTILTAFLGYDMFREVYWWVGYAAMTFAIMVFHKWAAQDTKGSSG